MDIVFTVKLISQFGCCVLYYGTSYRYVTSVKSVVMLSYLKIRHMYGHVCDVEPVM